MRVTVHPDAIGAMNRAERATWGIVAYVLDPDWQRLGVLPPPALCDVGAGDLSSELIASVLGITTEQAGSLLSSLVRKAGMSVERGI